MLIHLHKCDLTQAQLDELGRFQKTLAEQAKNKSTRARPSK